MSAKRQLKMTNKEISKLMKEVDQNGDGTIDLTEFFNVITCAERRDVIFKELIKRSGIRETFQKYDRDENGVITTDEFKKMMSDKYPGKFKPDEIVALMNKADKDGSGMINYEEFLQSFAYFPVTK